MEKNNKAKQKSTDSAAKPTKKKSKYDKLKGKGPIDISGTGSNYLESDFVSV
jgi:hypothetical protein